MELEGLTVPIPTLFDTQGAVDGEKIRHFVSGLCDREVDHIFALGTLGEFPSVEDAERGGILRASREGLRGRVNLWVGCGAPSVRRAVRYAREAADTGATALLAVPPYFLKPTEEGIVDYYRAIRRATALPLLAYNIPSHVGYGLRPELVHHLAQEGVLAGVKDTSGRFESVKAFLAGAPAGFAVLPGDDVLAFPGVRQGAAGAVMGLANIVPGLCVRLLRAARSSDPRKGEELQQLLERFAQAVELGPFPATDKMLAQRLRAVEVGYRAPFGPPTAEEEGRVLSALAPIESSLRALI